MAERVPCAVVVDARNVLGQSRRVFGAAGRLSVPGIKSALSGYGFEVVEVRVGLATRVLQGKCSDHVRKMQERNAELARSLSSDGAHILSGHLAERASSVEEKQVDVLCAMAIADLAERILVKAHAARCIVSLSEDMDLMPAYDFATHREVPVYAAAQDSVHIRPGQRDWLILDETALDACCPTGSSSSRLAVRSTVARQAAEGVNQSKKWRVDRQRRGTNESRTWEMSSNNGVRGLLVGSADLHHGQAIELWPQGLTTSAGSSQVSSPCVLLAGSQKENPWTTGIALGVVDAWESPTRVRVQLPDGSSVRCWAPVGSAAAGQRVLLAQADPCLARGDAAWSFVGPVPEPKAPPVLPSARELLVVNAGGPSSAWVWASLASDGQQVALLWKDEATRPRQGDTLVGVRVMQHPSRAVPGYIALSTALPRARSN